MADLTADRLRDVEYLRMAYRVAANSKDRSTQNGAVLVDPAAGEVVATGWNDIFPPFADTEERRTVRPTKYEWVTHCELDALLGAARAGRKTAGLWMYCTWFSCLDCARAVVRAGITRGVWPDLTNFPAKPEWARSLAVAEQMYREGGVEIVRLTEKLGVRALFNGAVLEV